MSEKSQHGIVRAEEICVKAQNQGLAHISCEISYIEQRDNEE